MKCRYGHIWYHVWLVCFSEPLMKFTNLCELRKWTFNAKRLYWTFQPDEIVETPWILMIMLFWDNLRNKSSKTIERKCSTCIMSYLDKILNAFRNISPQNMNFNGGKRNQSASFELKSEVVCSLFKVNRAAKKKIKHLVKVFCSAKTKWYLGHKYS